MKLRKHSITERKKKLESTDLTYQTRVPNYELRITS